MLPVPAGALSPEAVKALHARVNVVCRQLGAEGGRLALALCDGFGIPDHLLQVPCLLHLLWSAVDAPAVLNRAPCLLLLLLLLGVLIGGCRSLLVQAPIAIGDWRSFQG